MRKKTIYIITGLVALLSIFAYGILVDSNTGTTLPKPFCELELQKQITNASSIFEAEIKESHTEKYKENYKSYDLCVYEMHINKQRLGNNLENLYTLKKVKGVHSTNVCKKAGSKYLILLGNKQPNIHGHMGCKNLNMIKISEMKEALELIKRTHEEK